MKNIYIARQPIYNRNLKVVGYELLFRSFDSDNSGSFDGDQATTEVILNAFMEFGLDELVGGGLAFINLTRGFIIEQYPLPMLENRVVLEVLEDIKIDDELVKSLEYLSERGYKIALDDVVEPKDVAPLLDLADIVKIDIMGMSPDRIKACVAALKGHKTRLLAEKIETHKEFELCRELGFHYFQGFFFSKPNVVQGRKIPEARFALLRLLSKLQSPAIEFRDMEDIIRQDVSLSYKLLRLINSSYYARPRKINSIRQALTLLGMRQIKDWVSLLSLSTIEDKPRELMVTAMVRARMSETLSNSAGVKNAEAGFTVGLFSVLDALLDLPLNEVLSNLPLAGDVTKALVSHEGKLGTILQNVIDYEHGEWGSISIVGLKPDKVRDAYFESVTWANAVAGVL